jgi:hypothetical protein
MKGLASNSRYVSRVLVCNLLGLHPTFDEQRPIRAVTSTSGNKPLPAIRAKRSFTHTHRQSAYQLSNQASHSYSRSPLHQADSKLTLGRVVNILLSDSSTNSSAPLQLHNMADVHIHPMHRTVLADIVERGTPSISEFDMKDRRTTTHDSRTPGMTSTPHHETVDMSQPAGVQQMEAITIVWTKKWLIVAYALSILTCDNKKRACTD